MKPGLVETLKARGFIHQATDLDGLDALAAERPITAYIGFDLTAPSLHVGSLIQIMALRCLIAQGHKAIIVLGTSTTQIGDPSGKDTSRPILPISEIEQNLIGIENVLTRLVPGAEFIENDWFNLNYIEFLRHYGPLFTVNRMLALDSVKSRLDRKEPMTFLEFNYTILQSIDFLELASQHGVDLQIGGSDQWGNIVGGADLTRRVMQKNVFGLTTPLMTNAAGEKMGKTAGGAIWLDAERTSPFDFWQFWRNIDDDRVEPFFYLFTEGLEHAADHGFSVHGPGINAMKAILADEVTKLVHGEDAARQARATAEMILSGGVGPDTPVVEFTKLELLSGRERITIVDALLRTGLVSSKGDGDRQAKNGGVKINGEVITDVRRHFTPEDFLPDDETIRLSLGKKKVVALRMTP